MKKLMIGMIVAMAVASAFAEVTTEAKEFAAPDGETLLYRLHVTPGIAAGKKVPLVFFMHGAGERGNDNISQLRHSVSNLIMYADAHGGAVVVMPQCPQEQKWVNMAWSNQTGIRPVNPSAPMARVMALMHEFLKDERIDTSRVYLTGISMGGYATWDFATREPELFAAVLPVCGGGDPTVVESMKDVPVWAFHGSADGAVPVCRTRQMMSALWSLGVNKAHYTEYPDAGHNIWIWVYSDAKIMNWLFAQRKQ